MGPFNSRKRIFIGRYMRLRALSTLWCVLECTKLEPFMGYRRTAVAALSLRIYMCIVLFAGFHIPVQFTITWYAYWKKISRTCLAPSEKCFRRRFCFGYSSLEHRLGRVDLKSRILGKRWRWADRCWVSLLGKSRSSFWKSLRGLKAGMRKLTKSYSMGYKNLNKKRSRV